MALPGSVSWPEGAVAAQPDERLAVRINTWLARAAWLMLAVGAAVLALTPGPTTSSGTEPVLTAMTVGLGLVVVARLMSAAIAWPQRRNASAVLLISLVLWAVGSSILTASPDPDLVGFPAPGEGWFLAAYALMAAFLLLDTVHRGRIDLATALEAVIMVGGTVCLAGAALLTPAASHIQGEGISPLIGLLYPLIDLLLTAAVLADLVLRRRSWSRQSGSLLAGFALLTATDSVYSWGITDGTFEPGVVTALCWGMALLLIAAGACGPRQEAPADAGPQAGLLPFAAAFVALTVLALTPATGRALYLTGPAVITLLAAGARMRLALQAARGAAEASRLSLTDDLTDLPNRRALMSRLAAEDRPGTAITLLLLDLDGFKDVNDTLGHIAGDQVLQQISRRLRDELGNGTMISRLGGDEFAAVLATGDERTAMLAAARIRELVAAPLEALGHRFLMTASVGVANSHHQHTRSDLLRRADVGMYQAKTTRAGALMYDPDRDEFTTERLKTAEHLRLGIPAGQLRAWYQPQVEATTQRLIGLEALVRWDHPELGILPPGAFLGIARQTGLMPLLTETVLGLVLADVQRWHRAGARFQVSFNIAPPELLNQSLLERLLAQVDAAGLPPDTLVLEVTEDSLLADPERARLALLEIRRHRVEISIDDYGTGFSSLSYLRDLPVHELKLDQSFISTVRTDPRSRIIVASTNQMAQGLGLRTVAEGVEDELIAETVRELGIDLLQGYFIARPMPGGDVLSWQAGWQESVSPEPATPAHPPSPR